MYNETIIGLGFRICHNVNYQDLKIGLENLRYHAAQPNPIFIA
jgi:hypothetical protein